VIHWRSPNFGPPVADVQRHCVAIDFNNNDLSWASDEIRSRRTTVATNIRIYAKIGAYNTPALSTQPFYGGPVYLIRKRGLQHHQPHLQIEQLSSRDLSPTTIPSVARNKVPARPRSGKRALSQQPISWEPRNTRWNREPTPYSTLDYNGYRPTQQSDSSSGNNCGSQRRPLPSFRT